MNRISKTLIILLLYFPFAAGEPSVATSYIRETREDIQEALINFPERVPSGPEVRTNAGAQLTLGSVPRDFRINQEIYNDILILQSKMQKIVQLTLNLGIKPALLDEAKSSMNAFLTLLEKMGIRYGMRADFTLIQNELRQILQDISNAPQEADFMLFRPRLETVIAEIENALRTKFVR